MRGRDQVDPPVGLERAHVQVVVEQPDVVDADLVAERLEDVEVRVAQALNPLGIAE